MKQHPHKKTARHQARSLLFLLVAGCVLGISCSHKADQITIFKKGKAFASITKNDNPKDAFINNPFAFTILKNYSDNFGSIGKILSNTTTCPLQKENIADPAFCMIRTVEYDGLQIRVFSFDVLQSGTAEYLVSNDSIQLVNGLGVNSSKEEVLHKMGKPFKVLKDDYIWRSRDLHNFLVFSFQEDKIVKIRWHEEREPTYKNVIVWDTTY